MCYCSCYIKTKWLAHTIEINWIGINTRQHICYCVTVHQPQLCMYQHHLHLKRVMHVCLHLVCNAMNASEMCYGWFLFVSTVKPRQPWTCSGRTPWPPRRRRRKRSSTRILQMEGGAGWWCCTASWYVHLKLNLSLRSFILKEANICF